MDTMNPREDQKPNLEWGIISAMALEVNQALKSSEKTKK